MNIEKICNIKLLEENFKKCVKGYHLINSSPIIEKIWEDINANLFTSVGIDVHSKSNGSHAPGMDIQCSLGGISNKSGKYSNGKQKIDISGGQLCFFEKKIYKPLSYSYVQDCLEKIIDNTEHVDFIMNYLKDNREVEMVSDIRRSYTK